MAKPTKKQLDYIASLAGPDTDRLGIDNLSPATREEASKLIAFLKNAPSPKQIDYFDSLVADVEMYSEDMGRPVPSLPELPRTKKGISKTIDSLKTMSSRLRGQRDAEEAERVREFEKGEPKSGGSGCLVVALLIAGVPCALYLYDFWHRQT